VTLLRFRDDPWRESHPAYAGSPLAIIPAPEYASSEVILSSLYRAVGFPGLAESAVAQRGRELDREIQRHRNRRRVRDGAALDPDTLHGVLNSALESPKLPNQSSSRFLQVTPLVPQVAVFSGSPRTTGSPWSAGALMRRMVSLGATSEEEARETWRRLFDALSVVEDDDVFARFLQREVLAWAAEPVWSHSPLEQGPCLSREDRDQLAYPARRFVADLGAVIEAKGSLTRRQWTSILEAILRIAAVSHVMWLCEVHIRTWACIRRALSGEVPADVAAIREAMYPRAFAYLAYGDRALPPMKDLASGYLRARIGLNGVLWAMADIGEVPGGVGSARDLLALAQGVAGSSATLADIALERTMDELEDRENRAILCSKGIGHNMMEFARHVLGQRQSANPVLRGYDQGYVLRKKSAAKSSPWVVGLGPVAALALVHTSLAGSGGPRSVRRLAQHLAAYGVTVDHRDISQNDLGHQLRMLGLVLDSPDAESGMLLVPPFGGPTL
jgi:hypothetical protein